MEVSLCLDSSNWGRTKVFNPKIWQPVLRRAGCLHFTTLTYAIDTVLAFSGYMSMYKHRMKHMGASFGGFSQGYRVVHTGCRMIYKTVRSSAFYISALHACCCGTRKSGILWVFRNAMI